MSAAAAKEAGGAGAWLPRLRSDLRVTADAEGGFVVEDPVRSQFYRVGPAEYRVLSYLDGKTPLPLAAERAARGATTAVPASRLEALAQWLVNTQLLVAKEAYEPAQTPTPTAVNPCYVRMPLLKGEAALARLTPAVGWIFSWPAAACFLVLTVVAGFQVAANWGAFASTAQHVFYPDQAFLLAACWLGLKLLHELGHGVACKRFGGEVREFGVAMIYFVPVPYTDVTTSWRCSRPERMAIAAAGMYVEWIVALAAVAIWSWTGSAAVRHVCVYVVGLATIATVLFNANPLCRMDGYYLLSDWLGRPNLAAQGQRIAQHWLGWLITGQPVPPADMPMGRYWLLGCYGTAGKLWRTLSLVTMALLVVLVYEGFGVLLLVTIAVLGRLQANRRASSANPEKPKRLYAGAMVIRLVIACALSAGLWCWAPWPGGVAAPGTIENVERHVVRAPCAGQVVEVMVENGQRVEKGQVLARLRNDELALELAELELAYAQGEVKLRSQRTRKQLVDWQVEERRQQALAQRIEDSRRQLADLSLCAPADGRVIARRLADLPGSHVTEGAEICSVASEELELRILVAQHDVPAYAAKLGQEIDVRLPGTRLNGVLVGLEPHATASLAETNLGAHAGGPLAVVAADRSGTQGEAAEAWKLAEPRIIGHVRLPNHAHESLLAGQRGAARVRPPDYTVGRRLANRASEWLRKLSAQARERIGG